MTNTIEHSLNYVAPPQTKSFLTSVVDGLLTLCLRRVFSATFAHTPPVKTGLVLIAYASHELAPNDSDRVPV